MTVRQREPRHVVGHQLYIWAHRNGVNCEGFSYEHRFCHCRGAPLQWQKHQSAHFVFWFMPGSQAENNVTPSASSLGFDGQEDRVTYSIEGQTD